MLSFELLARIRKELFLTGSAFYETIVAIAERVNRKVHVLRLHGQATTILQQIHIIHQQIGRRIAASTATAAGSVPTEPAANLAPLEDFIRVAADRIKSQRTALQQVERQIRELKMELAHEDLLTMQRELGLRDAAIERVVVARGAPVIGHPIGEFDFPPTTHIAAVFRGPFLLPLLNSLTLRPDDIVIVVGLRHDLAHWLPHFQRPAASKTA
ncbi:TrkA C-terminal domain-containing protein [Nitrospira defluvii]|uniref:RCK C-terminal domain-containing protein n=1 Tax=Nitrospira defluvii TaxID=330214 RepID=A0ABM8RSY0_9BACT|nr:TrkA C-terminal domain-containing protein [Nitrospira defluvii]CAE6769888.1 RCK C-terminal domain-containing protein [Nitrospira defluvii]